MEKENGIFVKRPFVMLFAFIAALTWAFAFPLIKLGFEEFGVADSDTGAKTLFAGIRFTLAGVLILVPTLLSKKKINLHGGKNTAFLLLLFSLVNTSFHYFFFYIGLSNCSGSRSSIIDSLGTFLLIILACIVFRDEHLTVQKIIGCVLGFSGIVVINLGTIEGTFTFSGDGMLLVSCTCAALGGILTRIVTKRCDAVYATGISLGVGGIFLVAAGFIMGGRLHRLTLKGGIILLCLVLVSAVGFLLYNKLISCNPVGDIAIFNSFIPILSSFLSCIFLGEEFHLKYLFAGLLIVAGVYVINNVKNPKRKNEL